MSPGTVKVINDMATMLEVPQTSPPRVEGELRRVPGETIGTPISFDDKIALLKGMKKLDVPFSMNRIQFGKILCNKQTLKPGALSDFQTSCIIDAQSAKQWDSAAFTNTEAINTIESPSRPGMGCFSEAIKLPIEKDKATGKYQYMTEYLLDPPFGYSCNCVAELRNPMPESWAITCKDNEAADQMPGSKSPKRRRHF